MSEIFLNTNALELFHKRQLIEFLVMTKEYIQKAGLTVDEVKEYLEHSIVEFSKDTALLEAKEILK